MDIKNILAKYENFYVGGSGYTFQVEVDEFNDLIKEIENLNQYKKVLMENSVVRSERIEELEKEIEEHCETKGKLGKQVFTLTKRVDELKEENSTLKRVFEYL